MTAHFLNNNVGNAIQDLLQGPKYPDKEFVRGGATFGEVYRMAARLRVALAGLRPQGAVVCYAAEDKATMAASLLASLAGGPTLLLPYAFSINALAQLHKATGFTTAIADTSKEFPEGVKVLSPTPVGAAALPTSTQIDPQSELVKIFTGGSTGTPQVWSKTGENIFGEGFFLAQRFAVSEDDCILATIPPYHIYGLLFSVILPLVSSATVISITPSFPNEICGIAKKQDVTILASVPIHYRVLRDRKMSLRLAFSSAGMLDQEDNQMFCRQNSHGIVEVYGSTETGGIATRNRSLGEEFFTPFPTISWKINDSRLAVHSPYISPDLPVDDVGFFTTSDRVEARGTNQFALKGRTDTVTKVGGKRVDLQEIGLLIKQQPGVTDCVVTALPEAGGREHCIGALIQGDTANTKAIKTQLSNSLEPYALPRRLKKVDRIPVSDNGKYDWIAIARLLEK
ncbi:MAG: acyl--CoA ligase [Proteobacteria bacterium]|nr:acyl--CoA ligase [Pseudomonadota bacterium]